MQHDIILWVGLCRWDLEVWPDRARYDSPGNRPRVLIYKRRQIGLLATYDTVELPMLALAVEVCEVRISPVTNRVILP